MDWQRRQRLFFVGAPLALIPALVFLPAFVFLILDPRFTHHEAIAGVLFPLLLAAEAGGLWRLARCVSQTKLDLVTLFAIAVLLILVVIASYTGLFLATIATAL